MQWFLIGKLHYISMYITSRVYCDVQRHWSHTNLLLTLFGEGWIISENPFRHGRRPLNWQLCGAALWFVPELETRSGSALLCRQTHSEENLP
jgi:hypothetical protein